jgi:hypothetical protein
LFATGWLSGVRCAHVTCGESGLSANDPGDSGCRPR